jgi:hypothetical protein
MATRANWKGFLRLSLVSCPIALFPATSEADKISFNQINKKTGHRIKYLKVDADTGEEVETSDIIKGYKVDADRIWKFPRKNSITSPLNPRAQSRSTSLCRNPKSTNCICSSLLSGTGWQGWPRRLRGDPRNPSLDGQGSPCPRLSNQPRTRYRS